MLIQQLPKTVGAVKRKDQNAYRGESDLLREYEFTNLCVFAAQRFFYYLTLAVHAQCDSSARAIRKTALRAYCGCRRCFTH